jgi:hypothetical protein
VSRTLQVARTRITILFNWPDFVEEGRSLMEQVMEKQVEAGD